MHEFTLAQCLLEIVDEYTRKDDIARVNSIRLSFGRLSSVEPSALRFAFEIQAKGTKAEGASLEFEILPVIIYCTSCEKEEKGDLYQLVCPVCGGSQVVLTGGMEKLQIREMDVD